MNTELGHAHAACTRPVEAVREPARRDPQEHFLADHAEEVRTLRAALVPALDRARKRYGGRPAFLPLRLRQFSAARNPP